MREPAGDIDWLMLVVSRDGLLLDCKGVAGAKAVSVQQWRRGMDELHFRYA